MIHEDDTKSPVNSNEIDNWRKFYVPKQYENNREINYLYFSECGKPGCNVTFDINLFKDYINDNLLEIVYSYKVRFLI